MFITFWIWVFSTKLEYKNLDRSQAVLNNTLLLKLKKNACQTCVKVWKSYNGLSRNMKVYAFTQILCHAQHVTQGQYLSRVQLVWIQSFSSRRLFDLIRMKVYENVELIACDNYLFKWQITESICKTEVYLSQLLAHDWKNREMVIF